MVGHGPWLGRGRYLLQVSCVGRGVINRVEQSFPDITVLLPAPKSNASPAIPRVEKFLFKRKAKALLEAGAVNYQQFKKGKGTKKEPRKPEKEEKSRPINSNYLVYEINRSDGSVIYVPII